MTQPRISSAWRFAWVYWAIVALSLFYVALAAPDSLGLRAYVLTLPWSVFSYGAASQLFGWSVLVVGFSVNTLVLLGLGLALNQRRRRQAASPTGSV